MVGREEEQAILQERYDSEKSEFVAVYGRRRIGKTYMIRKFFKDKFTFQFTGIANTSLKNQIQSFNQTFENQFPKIYIPTTNWVTSFELIKKCIEKSKQKKKVIFIDELPWLDTPRSNFMQSLEHFWNSWASARTDVLLIVCGSSASWMMNKLINNKGGLHNRVTQRLKIEPFTLKECEQFIKFKKVKLEQYHILQLYMVFGGIPFYWDEIKNGETPTQIIDRVCFSKNGLLRTEFQNIFKSLFVKAENHQNIVQVLSKKSIGLTRKEIIKLSKIPDGGGLTHILNELEESGFIRKYKPFNKKNRDSLYQLVDFYTHFYFKFIEDHDVDDKNFWLKTIDNPKYRAWSGYAFEQVCLYHTDAIKTALGISGIETKTSSWRSKTTTDGAQIDLVIDRRDGAINLCEMKFSNHPFEITKKYDEILRNKTGIFREETKTKKALFTTIISAFGVRKNQYSWNIQHVLTMKKLFDI